MGGHGGLNILPQKSWNVWNRANRARVAHDEAEAAQRAADEEFRAVAEQSGLNLLALRARAGAIGQDQDSEAPGLPAEHVNLFAEAEAAEQIAKRGQESKRKEAKEIARIMPDLDLGKSAREPVPWYAQAPVSFASTAEVSQPAHARGDAGGSDTVDARCVQVMGALCETAERAARLVCDRRELEGERGKRKRDGKDGKDDKRRRREKHETSHDKRRRHKRKRDHRHRHRQRAPSSPSSSSSPSSPSRGEAPRRADRGGRTRGGGKRSAQNATDGRAASDGQAAQDAILHELQRERLEREAQEQQRQRRQLEVGAAAHRGGVDIASGASAHLASSDGARSASVTFVDRDEPSRETHSRSVHWRSAEQRGGSARVIAEVEVTAARSPSSAPSMASIEARHRQLHERFKELVGDKVTLLPKAPKSNWSRRAFG